MSNPTASRAPTLTLAAALVAVASLAVLAVWQANRAPSPSPSLSPELQAAWTTFLACRAQSNDRSQIITERGRVAAANLKRDATTIVDGIRTEVALVAFRNHVGAYMDLANARLEYLQARLTETTALQALTLQLENLGLDPADNHFTGCR